MTLNTFFGFAILVLNILIVDRIVCNFKSGFYNSTLMKGSTRMTYLLSMYIVDVLHYLLFILIVYILTLLFGFIVPGFWLATLTFAMVNPIWLYLMTYTFGLARGWKVSTVTWF